MNIKLKTLNESASLLKSGQIENAMLSLKNLLENNIDSNNYQDLKYTIFASALLKQTNQNKNEMDQNIYLKNFDGLSQIDVFELIANKFPITSLSHQIANEAIHQIVKNKPSFTLLDIGIGKGAQTEKLIEKLAQNPILKNFTIIGIDPNPENIAESKEKILNSAEKYSLDINFIGIAKLIEDLTEKEWLELSYYSENLVVNSAFALHHSLNPKRQKIIQNISDLNPKAVVISEPDSDHNTPDLCERFKNAWNHFNLVFDLIDKLEISKLQGYLLKECFLGREIEDILGNKELFRSERHESTNNWLERFYKEKFKPINLENFCFQGLTAFPTTVNKKEEYIGIEYKDTNLASIICLTK